MTKKSKSRDKLPTEDSKVDDSFKKPGAIILQEQEDSELDSSSKSSDDSPLNLHIESNMERRQSPPQRKKSLSQDKKKKSGPIIIKREVNQGFSLKNLEHILTRNLRLNVAKTESGT